MKVLFIERGLSGHRKIYHKTLIESIGVKNAVLITPEVEPDLACEQVIDESINLSPRTIRDYQVWIKIIKNTAARYAVTIIHFLDGDLLYRFFGYKLDELKNYKTIVTFHHIGEDFIHYLSFKLIIRRVTYGILHTEKLKNRFQFNENVKQIDYPYFPLKEYELSRERARDYYHIEMDKIVLLALGGTRYEKGVDILLSSLKDLDDDNIILLIAGEEMYFKYEDLKKIDTGKVKPIFYMKQLTDMEWSMALSACDYVVLPYRKSFNGASGPLTEAVWFEKPIIGKRGGSIGEIIRQNELGWTFEDEMPENLAEILKIATSTTFQACDKYKRFKQRISVKTFINKYHELYFDV